MKFLAVVLAFLALAGCSKKNIQTKEAVRDAVVEYLTTRQDKTGIDMNAMNVDVVNMSFEANRARVVVAFTLKAGAGGMQMPYELERQGDKWIVKGAVVTGGGGDNTAPGGGAAIREKPLPANHPDIQRQLPPGHAPVTGVVR